MAKVKVTKEEYELITRQVARIFKHREGLSRYDGNKEKKSSYQLVKKLYNKLFDELRSEVPADGVVLSLHRTELRLLQSMLGASINILNSSTIPGYMKRIDEKDQPEKHKEYMDKAIKLRDEVMAPLLTKIEGAL